MGREDAITSIVERLTAPIPHRPKPPPKPRASWKGWKVGDQLTSPQLPSALYEVESCTTEGASLRMVKPFRATHLLVVTTEETQSTFQKVRKPRKPRKTRPKAG